KTIDVSYTKTTVDHDGSTTSGLRVYSQSPECAVLQIRTYGAVTPSRAGKARPAYSTASLNHAEIAELIELLQLELARIRNCQA
ncbi:MAG TPA: hypothetical protein VNH41_04970, partial [Steroidobacteraceae bacterium]|nr:hypothetical protein [Steroidobacteraceae bacterium]